MTVPPSYLAIFDHDGVLVDSLPFHQAAWLELGRRTGLPITEQLVLDTFGMTNPAIFRLLVGDQISADEIDRFGALKEACYRDIARDQIALMDGVATLLGTFPDHGVALAIGTSGPRANALLTVEACGLTDQFHTIAALEDIQRSKPDPEVFLLAADRVGIDPRFAVVFEDAPIGIQAARAAGMYAVGVTSTRSAEALRAAGADEVVSSLAGYSIPTFIGRLSTIASEREPRP